MGKFFSIIRLQIFGRRSYKRDRTRRKKYTLLFYGLGMVLKLGFR